MMNLEETIRTHQQRWPVAPKTDPWDTYMQYRHSVQELLLDVAGRLKPQYFTVDETPVKDRLCNIMRGGTKRSLCMHGGAGNYSFVIGTQTTTLTDIGWPNPWTSREEHAYLRVYENGPESADATFITEHHIDSHYDGNAVRHVTDAIERQMRNHSEISRRNL